MRLIIVFAQDIVWAKVLDSNNKTIIGRVDSIAQAKALRQTAGDIVFHESSGVVCEDKGWLWDWEVSKNVLCYTMQCIENKAKLMSKNQWYTSIGVNY